MGSTDATTNTGPEEVGYTRISDEDIKRIRDEVVSEINKELPKILREFFPTMVDGLLPTIVAAVEKKTTSHLSAREEAKRFIEEENPTKFNECLLRRKKVFQQYQRCESLIQLYDECKEEDPPYIPRKFREDKFQVNDQEELDIVNRRSMANFQCQHDILIKRKRDFATMVNNEDDLIIRYVEENVQLSPDTRIEISNIWQKRINEDETSSKEI